LCRAHGTLAVFDETLTGLYRTGLAFHCSRLRQPPDVLLFAKSLGNGFPVASIAIGAGLTVPPGALPGSTFSGNALALAAVQGTLEAMAALPMVDRVAAIEATVSALQPALAAAGARLRGRGALWCIEFPSAERARRVHAAARAAGLLLSCTDRAIRLVPAATVSQADLQAACDKILQACQSAA
jgi:acetylornithine/succinyldiaminopimelate/putrescine aminotransferase